MFSVCLKTLESLFYSVHCDISIILFYYIKWGMAVAQLVDALRYKPEGRGFDSQWCH